jgi:hypothetical protein
VTNLGPSVARDVDLKVRTLELPDQEQDLTPRVPVAPALLVGQQRDVRVEIPRPESRRGNLVLWARWRDEIEDHEEPLIPIQPIVVEEPE